MMTTVGKLQWPWFTFEVRSSLPLDPERQMGEVLASVVEDPPLWATSLAPRVTLGTQSEKGRKVRTLQVENPTPTRVRSSFSKPRPARTCGGGVMFIDEDPPAVWVDLGIDSHGFIGTFRSGDPGSVANEELFGDASLRMAQLLVEAGGDVRWGAGWFGWYSAPPLSTGVGLDPARGCVPGYSYLACFPPPVADRLGGTLAVKASVAETVREVKTASGEMCVLALLRRSPAAVTESLLREWRLFLAPVLPHDAAERRAEAFSRMSVPASDVWYDLPPMVLRDDWPSP